MFNGLGMLFSYKTCKFLRNLSVCFRNYARTSSSGKTHYETLGVDPGCSQEEIKRAFIEKSKTLHPDTTLHDGRDSHKEFVILNNAFSVLSKPTLRRKYDISLQRSTAYGMQRSWQEVEQKNDSKYWQDYWKFSREHGGGGQRIPTQDHTNIDKSNSYKDMKFMIAAMIIITGVCIYIGLIGGEENVDIDQFNKGYTKWLMTKRFKKNVPEESVPVTLASPRIDKD